MNSRDEDNSSRFTAVMLSGSTLVACFTFRISGTVSIAVNLNVDHFACECGGTAG